MARKREPRVMGIDPSLTATGIALSDSSTLVVKDRTVTGDRRLAHIYSSVLRGAWLHDFAVMEDMPANAKSAGITAQAHGVVKLALIMSETPFITIPPATLKKAATGVGNCDKSLMKEVMLELYTSASAEEEAEANARDDNEVDAWWLRLCGVSMLGGFANLTAPEALDRYQENEVIMAQREVWK